MVRQALSDISVVEVGRGFAAAWCGKVFADLGADVSKLEPPGGDPMRRQPARHHHLDTNKRSVVVEPTAVTADEVWRRVAGADLVIEAPGQGALADWGIDRADVLARSPRTSVLAITGWGLTGPYADYAWSDLVAQTFGGVLLRDPVRGPLKVPMSLGEAAVGHTAALGGLAAVLRSRSTGVGAVVDCAAVEALMSPPMRITAFLGWEYKGRVAEATLPVAGTSGSLLPVGIFPCADGHMAMMMTPQQLGEMLSVVQSPELDEAFARPDAFVRPETKEILDGVLYPWLFARTREEITVVAQAAGWPAAGVNEPHEVLAADHLHQRGFWAHVDVGELGRVLLPGAPYRLAEGGWRLRRGAPALGDDTPLPGGTDPVEVSPSTSVPARPTISLPPVAGSGAPADPAAPPLQGIRVLDITTVYSGPFLTLLLADLGAEVIRVETPHVFPPTTKGYLPRPDAQMLLGTTVGAYGPLAPGREDRPWNRHSMNNAIARNKRSCTLDVRFPEQRELFLRLVAESDVFVENLKSSTLHQMGLHETQLLEANPELIVLRLPPAGLSGDWAHYTGFGAQFDGLTGLTSLCGHRDTDLYESPSTMHMDSVTGPAGAFALLSALHYRDATGRGQVIEMAQSENVLSQLGEVYLGLQLGQEPQRLGNRDLYRAPQGIYHCADGRWLAVTVTDDDAWLALAGAIDRPDLAARDDLRSAEGRHAAHDELDRAIGDWTAAVAAVDAFGSLQDAGVAAAPYLDDEMLASDPQISSRDWIRPLSSPDVGEFDHLGHAYRGIPLVWERGAPTLGQDNEYVFKELLGLDDAEYQRLVAERVAAEDYFDRNGDPY